MKEFLWMRWSVLALVLYLLPCQTYSQNTGQILASSSGKYCRFKVSDCKQRFDTLEIVLSVDWINENLQPVQDAYTQLVLKKDRLKTSAEGKVRFPDFVQRDQVSFNRSFPLRLVVDKGFTGSGIQITLDAEIDASKTPGYKAGNESGLTFRNPDKLVYNAGISHTELVRAENKPPEIKIISPLPDATGKRTVHESIIDIIGYAQDASGINLVLVNANDAKTYPDGKFISSIALAPGENEIRITAIDNDGTITEERITIVCESYALASKMLNAGNYYALLIAIEQYEDPKISDLEHSIEDATSLYTILTRDYSFNKENVKLLTNPKFEDIVIELDRLNSQVTTNDNLLIFFAGHGIWSDQAKVGYWLPSDAKESNTAKWFRNSTLRDYIGSIKSKHTLLIADACFSGSIFKSRAAFANAPAAIEKVYELPSRKAMTSGSLSEVPDKSIFLEFLIKRLIENSKPYITSEELFYSLKTAVINNSPTIPQFGEILNTGDEGGDFVFIRKR